VIAMDKVFRPRRGGPRTFDRDQALEIAMLLFWRHGYEGVSINDLTDAMGIAPPSLYAAFGSKAGLYGETLDRYFGLIGALHVLEPSGSLIDAVEALLRRAVAAATDSTGEGGCMISTAMVQCDAEHAEIARDLVERRRAIFEKIAVGLEHWLDENSAHALARYLMSVMQGLTVQARDGVEKADMERVVDNVIAGLSARDDL
jgi:AcrR family transcriptional regulator